MVSQHHLESFFHEIKCNGMTSFMEFMLCRTFPKCVLSNFKEWTLGTVGQVEDWASPMLNPLLGATVIQDSQSHRWMDETVLHHF